MIKPKYFSRETAPLRFLKVIKTLLKISIGLQILFLIIYIIPAFGLLGEYGIGILSTYAIRIGVIILTIAASENLDDWKWRGVNLLYLWLFVSCLLSAANQIAQQGMQWSIIIGCFLGWLIWMIPMYIYFEKRRALFTPPITAIPSDAYTQQEAQMKQFVVDDATGEVISETPVEEPKPVVLTYAPDFKLSGPPKSVVDDSVPSEPPSQPKPSKRNNVLFVVLAAICIASLAGNAVQAYLKINTQTQLAKIEEDLADKDTLIQNLKESSSTLQKQLTDAQDDINVRDNMIDEIAPEAFAMKTYIGFIYDGSKYCHSYNCSQFPFEDCASDGFYAHNVEYCEWLGYPKHSGCWN